MLLKKTTTKKHTNKRKTDIRPLDRCWVYIWICLSRLQTASTAVRLAQALQPSVTRENVTLISTSKSHPCVYSERMVGVVLIFIDNIHLLLATLLSSRMYVMILQANFKGLYTGAQTKYPHFEMLEPVSLKMVFVRMRLTMVT